MVNIVFVPTVIAVNDGTTKCWCLTYSDGTYEFDLLVRWFVYLDILLAIVPKEITDTIGYLYFIDRESIGCLMYRWRCTHRPIYRMVVRRFLCPICSCKYNKSVPDSK